LPFQHAHPFTSSYDLSKPTAAFTKHRGIDAVIQSATSNTDQHTEPQQNYETLSIVDVDVSLFTEMTIEDAGKNILSAVCVSESTVDYGSRIIGFLNELISKVPSNKPRYEILICIDEKKVNQEADQIVEHFLLPAIHRLFSLYLISERQYCKKKCLPSSWENIILRLEYSEDIGIKEREEKMLNLLQRSGWNKTKNKIVSDTCSYPSHYNFFANPDQLVQHLIHYALTNCSDKTKTADLEISNKSFDALEIMSLLSTRRVPFDFINDKPTKTFEKELNGNEGKTISYFPSLLPSKTIDRLTKIMNDIKRQGWLSNNLDSVDELPSLHMNIISGGSPMFKNDINGEDYTETKNEFQNLVKQMYTTLEPHLYEEILPQVKRKLGFKRLQISDVFVRNYGKGVQSQGNADDDQSNTRLSLSEHYDITATATCVIALDDTASQGTSGLYAIDSNECAEKSSSHTSLKRFFPLSTGDGVLHTWDILHGVDIHPSLKRNSLIIWFTEEEDNDMSHLRCFDNPSFDKAIRTFVLALSKENIMRSNDQSYADNGESDTDLQYRFKDTDSSILDLHIKNVLLGNSFALARIGTMLIDQVDGNESMVLSDSQLKTCCSLVESFEWVQNYETSYHWLPLVLTRN